LTAVLLVHSLKLQQPLQVSYFAPWHQAVWPPFVSIVGFKQSSAAHHQVPGCVSNNDYERLSQRL
jgi:hypothetical protein